ncbi:5'-hydroxyaverantin dehydrogenase [Lachnellula cervina]|uniref:5'-hydroxyaverantin dehydrogenase n=1 Tax=Lachnellula cervina TaxID=1316786 RepID=A0A7D8YQT3_9HELO|nr:5'-hydroxyaverantin dehydrogenase [Lachnellula cervina]
MPINKYEDKPVDTSILPSPEELVGKSAVVTGGSSGLGKGYVDAFIKAGAYVTIADIDEEKGQKAAREYPGQAQFVKCNVTLWEDQVKVFKAAVANSPHKSCDIVIANAGISGPDDVFQFDDVSKEPVQPDLRIININLIGILYTAKLAMHYFRVQPEDDKRDRCLIIKGSLAGFLDQPGSPQYNASKFGGRGLMRSLRQTSWQQGIRVNYIAPWYIKTPIMSEAVVNHVLSKGVLFALLEDACKAVLRVASDKSINGRALAIISREESIAGYIDVAHDDYTEGDFLRKLQNVVLVTSHRTAVSHR